MVIWFNSEKAREQLKLNGIVITCRVRRKQFGFTNAVYRDDNGIMIVIGRVNVQKLTETIDKNVIDMEIKSHRQAFRKYLSLSGFESLSEWEEKVLSLNRKGKIPSYLIFLKVTLVDVFI